MCRVVRWTTWSIFMLRIKILTVEILRSNSLAGKRITKHDDFQNNEENRTIKQFLICLVLYIIVSLVTLFWLIKGAYLHDTLKMAVVMLESIFTMEINSYYCYFYYRNFYFKKIINSATAIKVMISLSIYAYFQYY